MNAGQWESLVSLESLESLESIERIERDKESRGGKPLMNSLRYAYSKDGRESSRE